MPREPTSSRQIELEHGHVALVYNSGWTSKILLFMIMRCKVGYLIYNIKEKISVIITETDNEYIVQEESIINMFLISKQELKNSDNQRCLLHVTFCKKLEKLVEIVNCTQKKMITKESSRPAGKIGHEIKVWTNNVVRVEECGRIYNSLLMLIVRTGSKLVVIDVKKDTSYIFKKKMESAEYELETGPVGPIEWVVFGHNDKDRTNPFFKIVYAAGHNGWIRVIDPW